jgi:lipopolysaccharide export system protein LptA
LVVNTLVDCFGGLTRAAWAVAAIGLALLCTTGEAARADPLGVIADEVLDVTAQKLDVDIQRGHAVLEGDVRASLGDLQVQCPKVEMRYDAAPTVKWVRGSGGVRATLRDIAATAQLVEVDVGRRQVRLNGGVELRRGRTWVRADSAVIEIATRRVSLHDVKGSIPVEAPAR